MHTTPAARRWEPIVQRARQSGTSIRSFARQHGINENTLAWWNWRLGDDLGGSAFVEVTVADAPREHRELRVYVGAARVDVQADSDLALLRRVVEALS